MFVFNVLVSKNCGRYKFAVSILSKPKLRAQIFVYYFPFFPFLFFLSFFHILHLHPTDASQRPTDGEMFYDFAL